MRGKKDRFAHNRNADNLLQKGKPLFDKICGSWQKEYFKNKNPITLELACGRGEYSIGLARIFPQRNFIGMDVKGDRLWKGSSIALEEQLTNVAFLRAYIHDLDHLVAKDEIDDIWLVFPDPRPKDRDEKRRLTSSRFLDMYKHILAPDGYFRLKTDNTALFEYTLALLETRKDVTDLEYTFDLANSALMADHHGITTRYEQIFTNSETTVKYLKLRFTP